MTDLTGLGADVSWPDHDAASAAAEILARRQTGRGRLDELTEWIAGVQASCPPHDFTRVRAITFGLPEPDPAVEAGAALVGAGLRVIAPLDGPAEDAPALGAAIADDEVDCGADLLVVAYPGAATAAAVLVSVLTDTEPVKVVPRGAHVDTQTWTDMVVAVRDRRRQAFLKREELVDLVAGVGGADLAATVGFVLRAAVRRTPVVLDGTAALAAALVAYEAQPRAVRWWLAADRCPDTSHGIALDRLGLRSVLDLGTRTGDGTAGLLSVAVLRAAARQLGASAHV